jgi:hypothetical protein
MYWDLNKDLELVYEEILGTGETSYNSFLEYWINPLDFNAEDFFFFDSGNPDPGPVYFRESFPLFPHIGTLWAFVDYPMELSAVTGQTQYQGNLFGEKTGETWPPVYRTYIDSDTVKNWSVSDGVQTIYFSLDYELNTTEVYNGVTYGVYVGYGDDDDGSFVKAHATHAYDINFKVNTVAPVIISPHPHMVFAFNKINKSFNCGFSYVAPGGTGEVKVKYKYRPLDQPEKIRDKYSVDFDGNTERLQTSPTAQTLTMGATWTILAWVKPQSNDGNEQQVYCHGNDSNSNRIHLYRDTQDGDYPWVIDIMDVATNQKTYYFGPNLLMNTWHLIGARLFGGTLTVFVDGAVVTPTDTTQDDAISMTDTARQMAVGGKSMPVATDGFDGRIHSAMSWSWQLSEAAILYLWQNRNLDLREASGDYVTPNALQHWYRLGYKVSPDIGKDYGNDPFDLSDENDITDADIVIDYPS